jgi:hypothetical protein
MLAAALQLAARGLGVFPLVPRAKTPLCTHGCLEATCDPAIITQWWQGTPDANVGVATGRVDNALINILGLDIDGPQAEAGLVDIQGKHGGLPPTVETITGREEGGRQLWFSLPDNVDVPSTAGKLAPHIDTRGHHAYVVSPPSRHPNGRLYRWGNCASGFAPAPDWLLKFLVPAVSGFGHSTTSPDEWTLLFTDGVEEGRRNVTATKVAGYLLRRLHVGPAHVILHQWNARCCHPPLPDKDIDIVFRSVCGRELKRRTTNGQR